MSRISSNAVNAAQRYLPEPQSRAARVFKTVLDTVREAAGEAVGGVRQAVGGDFGQLISAQIAAQEEMQSTTMISNIEKSKHESKMSAIRNIRVG